jgi:NDP-sugar pyrophosphorylase family protein
MKAMLLAAGEGTRFRPQTLKLPKPALPLLNVPLGYYFFPYLESIAVDSIVVNTFHLPQIVEKLYQEQTYFKTEFSHEKGKILGSGGGLGNAQNCFAGEDDLILLNADEVFIPQDQKFLKDMREQHLKNKTVSTLLVSKHSEVGSKFGGIWVDANKNVVGYGKTKPPQSVEGYHYLGVQILNKSIFEFIKPGVEQNILYDNLIEAQKQGERVEIFETTGHWYETGNLKDYLATTKDLLSHLYKMTKEFEPFRRFLNEFAKHSQLESKNGILIWKDSSSRISNCEVVDFAVFGKKVEVRKSKVEASVFGPSTVLESGSVSRDLILY